MCINCSFPHRFRDGIGTFALDSVFSLPQLEVGELLAFARKRETRRFHSVSLRVGVENRNDLALFHHIANRVFHLAHHTGRFGAHSRPTLRRDPTVCLYIVPPRNCENGDDDNADRGGPENVHTSSGVQGFFIELGFVALFGIEFGLKNWL
jgi:hypothetical protein